MEYHAEIMLDIKAVLGECPLWSEKERSLYFVDILKPAIYRFNPVTNDLKEYQMPEDTGSIGLRENGGFIAAMRTGVYLLDENGAIIKKIANNPTDHTRSRFNDGRTDPWGHFWCGTVWEPGDYANAKLLRIDHSKMDYEIIDENLTISNGIAFSPDRRRMCYTDTNEHSLFRVRLNESTGEPQGIPEKIYDFGKGRPDGAAFDTEGNYWSAQFGGGEVVCLSPTGKILHKVAVPVKQITMAAFGGPEMDTLFITSSREHMSQEELKRYPQSGGIFSAKVNAKGIAEPFFKG